MAVLLAVFAAICNAVTTILQRLGVESAPEGAALRLKLVVYLLHRPVWFLGLVAMISGFICQATALSRGSLSTVQPIMVSELVFLVLILGIFFHQPVGWRELLGASATVAGLGAFLALSDQAGGVTVPTTAQWVLVIVACAGAIAITTTLGRFGSRAVRSASFGAAAAIAFALTAAFTKATTTLIREGGYVHLFGHWEVYGIAGGGLVGLFLAQNAFYAGPITASQASLTILDPIISIVIGVELFGDRIRNSPGSLILESLALLLMCAGLVVLCRSPLIASSTADERLMGEARALDEHQVRRAGRVGRSPDRG